MSGFISADGFKVSRGETLRMDANYDGRLMHTRVMGIMLVYLVPDESVKRWLRAPTVRPGRLRLDGAAAAPRRRVSRCP